MKKYGKEKSCLWCNHKFTPRIDYEKIGKGLFCSVSCAVKYRHDKNARRIVCLNCGVKVRVSKRARKYCSKKCAHQHHPPNFNPDRLFIQTRQRLTRFCHKAIARTLKEKTDRCFTLLGYTSLDLKTHIESLFKSGMSWENYGHKTWHIDHIRPISSFPPDASIREINALSNLQPLWAKENLRKNAKWNK